MDLSELKLISASNIIRLRQSAGLTQAELGAKLNYSDKTVSKWERGEAIPDAYTLTVIASVFNVDVNYLLSSHDQWEAPTQEEEEAVMIQSPDGGQYSAAVLITLVIVSVWTAALTTFVVLWLFGIVFWKLFFIALPVSLLVHIILLSVFYKDKNLQYYIIAFVLSILLAIVMFVPGRNPWELLIVAVPATVIVILACNLRKNPIKWLKSLRKK